jgi:hypothetical protein
MRGRDGPPGEHTHTCIEGAVVTCCLSPRWLTQQTMTKGADLNAELSTTYPEGLLHGDTHVCAWWWLCLQTSVGGATNR